VFIGTSTSGILQTELAYRRRDPATGALPAVLDYAHTHNTYSAARYLRERFDLAGPACVVSTACSSSAKVFATAARQLALGLIDAAIVGGVDSLCMTTLYGFHALELVSGEICRPWDAERRGLSIGEAAAFALLERPSDAPAPAWLLGAGETSDGHHMSSPHPEGAGACAAMLGALAAAGLRPADVDYLNLHGTATPGNDAAEDRAVHAVFGPQVDCSSTKGFTGHTLGAAGAVEAAIALLAMHDGLAPATLNLRVPDPALSVAVRREPGARRIDIVASNSFGFGGTNATLVFGRPR
jgi:3-oxoacyl-[acyl-carrier-protein] synthase-1